MMTTTRPSIRSSNRAVAFLAFATFAVMGLFSEMATAMIGYAGHLETTTQLLFDFGSDPWGALLFVIGLLGLIILSLGLAFHWIKGQPKALAGGYILLIILAAIGFLVASGVAAQQGAVVPPAPSSAQLSSYLIQYNAAGKGCSVNTVTNTETCTAVWNYTDSEMFIAPANGSTTGGSGACAGTCANWIAVGVHSARTDVNNYTYGFSYQVSSVPVVSSLYNPSTSYSPIVGYKVASGTSPGVWQADWGSGSTGGLFPSNAAPSSTSDFTASSVGIAAFGSATNVLHIALPGSNSTYAPSWGTGTQGSADIGMTTYGTYSMTFTVGNSSPATFTLVLQVIGFHA
jgi:hypothetical protein